MSAQAPWKRLVRMQLRRDRILLAGWITGGVTVYVSQAKSAEELYPTQASLDVAARSMADNAAMIAMTGPARALDTLGGQVAWQSAAYGAVVAGLMSMLVVVRHTRQEEETGRSELVLAGALGRRTPLLSALALALSANVVLGALVSLSLVGYGLPTTGSWALGAAVAATGWVFTGVASVAAQLTRGARSAYALTTAVIGASFLLRAIGDTGPQVFSWMSPIGWGQAVRPYADERWWPLAIAVGVSGALLVLALAMHASRDHADALWTPPAKPPADTDLTPWALAWRLQRGVLAGWATAVTLVGLGYGAMAESGDDVVGDSDLARDIFATGASPVDGFLGTGLLVLALLCAACGVMCAQRPDTEERSGRTDLLLSGGLTRTQWSHHHAFLALAGTAALLLLAGMSTGLGHLLASGDETKLLPLLGGAIAYLPAVLVITGTVHAAHALGRSSSLIGWALVGWCTFVGLFAQAMELPDLLAALAPVEHVPAMPVEHFDGAAAAALAAVAASLYLAARTQLRRRDLR